MRVLSEDFSVDLNKCTVPWNYVWVNSGFSTCAPVEDTVLGVKGCFSPPYAAKDTALSFVIDINGHSIEDTGNKGKGDCGLLFSGAFWYPDRIVRKGTYHYSVKDELLSVSVESELVPLYQKAGFLVKIRLRNRAEKDIRVKINPLVTVGKPFVLEFEKWDFGTPVWYGVGHDAPQITQITDTIWETTDCRITMLQEGNEEKCIHKDEVYECLISVVFSQNGENIKCDKGLASWREDTIQAWKRRFHLVEEGVPQIKSNIPGLVDYYRRSLVSGLVCIWENDAFITNPFISTSGMDGGSVCCYPWDVAGYSARTITMLLGEKALKLLTQMLNSEIDSHICMAINGKGLGAYSYSYSMWSIVNMYWTILTMTGKGFQLFDSIVRLLELEENRLEETDHLKDYGKQENLLEMRACGYEGFVVSPNAERAWCYDRLADIAEYIGDDKYRTDEWRTKAENIRKAIKEKLWDQEIGWFKCIHSNGHIEYVYSIQMYDAIRMSACTEEMAEAMLKHVADGKFLSGYGVNSVSAEDEIHYELNDPDWSGGGCYSGEGPELAETLWQINKSELAWDVLKRHFWQGTMVPYIPQEHESDKPMMPAIKRANIISGVAGLEAILFGMAGFKIGLDRQLTVEPQAVLGGWYEISGFKNNGRTVDLYVNDGEMKLHVDGEIFYAGPLQKVEI